VCVCVCHGPSANDALNSLCLSDGEITLRHNSVCGRVVRALSASADNQPWCLQARPRGHLGLF